LLSAAISSMKLSMKNAWCECPTERQKPTGTSLRVVACRMCWCAMA
jgi:hypothetical protein